MPIQITVNGEPQTTSEGQTILGFAPTAASRPGPRGRGTGPPHRETAALGRDRLRTPGRSSKSFSLSAEDRDAPGDSKERLRPAHRLDRSKAYAKLRMAPASSSWTSKTVYSLVICSRSFTRLLRLSSFNCAAAVGYGRESRNQLADSRAVDIGHLAEVEQNLLLALADHVAQRVAQGARSLAQRDPPRYVHYAYVAHLPSIQLYAH